MAMRIIYLDIDDEITTVASRIRSAEGSRVAVVLPYGSRVATSRINFRLLARDAQTNGKTLSVIAGDAATRALAASAGLPIFSTVGEYESSLAPDGAAPSGAAPGGDAPAPDTAARQRPVRSRGPIRGTKPVTDDTTATSILGATAAVGPVEAVSGAPTPVRSPGRIPAAIPAERVVADTRERSLERTPESPPDSVRVGATQGGEKGGLESAGRSLRRNLRRTPLIAAAAVLGLAFIVGGVGAFLFLPTATAVITPREASIGPVSLRIVADPGVTTPDAASLVVPAVTKTIDVETTQTFPATGKRVEEEKATGTVRFRSKDFLSTNTVPRGSVVSTQAGVRFRTDRAVTIPRAKLVGLTIIQSSASVKVTAVDGGPDANTEPNTILIIPRGEDPLTLDVSNPDATTGGKRDEFARIKQEDVDLAMTAIRTQLEAAFAERIADPELASDGATVFAATASLGEGTFSPDVTTLVGAEVDSFELGASASGTVVAVDEAPVQSVAEATIESKVESGYQLIDGSSQVAPSPAVIEGGVITFPVVVTARQVAVLDPAAIEAQILGQPLAEARSILERYGQVELSVWPDWVGTIPTLDARVEVAVP